MMMTMPCTAALRYTLMMLVRLRMLLMTESRMAPITVPAILPSPPFSVKEPMPKTTARLTLEGHAVKSLAGQALAGLMKPNLVSDLIQRGALR